MDDQLIEQEQQPRRRGRPPKTEAIVEERQQARDDRNLEERRARRQDVWDGTATPLDVPADIKAKYANSNLRWINDDGIRFHRLTKQDVWEPVKDHEGKTIRRPVGFRQTGEPMEAVLCEKPKDWYEEDRRKKQEQLDRDINAVMTKGSGAPDGIEQTGAGYVPDGNYLKRGSS